MEKIKDKASVTFQVTNDCCCKCSYCYEINKKNEYMSSEVADKCIDLIFQMSTEDNKNLPISINTNQIIFEFIGGEPFMNIEIIDYICTKILDKMILENHRWLDNFTFLITSNGAYHFTPKVQQFLDKFNGLLDIGITIDGPEETHNFNRKYLNNKGNFKDAWDANQNLRQRNIGGYKTKFTIVPSNLKDLYKSFLFFYNNDFSEILMTVANEYEWTPQQAKIFYYELKKIGDFLLQQKNENMDIALNLFNNKFGIPLEPQNIDCWCGATSSMIAFSPSGKIYPCIRFMESSLDNFTQPFQIGDYTFGIDIEKYKPLLKVNRRSKEDNECFNCPIHFGCPDCEAWNYQQYNQLNKKSKNICYMFKAQILANTYFWNTYYLQNNSKEQFILNLPKIESLKIISEKEYQLLIEKQKRG